MSYLSSGKTTTYLVARLCFNPDRYLSGAPSYPSNNSEPFLYVLYSHQLQWYRFPLASPASLERRLSALQLQNEMLITGFSPSSWIGTIDVSPILDWLLKNSSEPGTILIREEPVAPTASCIGLPVDNNTVVQFLPGGRFGVVLGGRCTYHGSSTLPLHANMLQDRTMEHQCKLQASSILERCRDVRFQWQDCTFQAYQSQLPPPL